jgi:hypothetical protein
MLALINPVRLAEPFDHADWVFETKFDGFRAAADTVHGRLISRNGNGMGVLDLLPKGYVFDGELVVLDDAGRPLFYDLQRLTDPYRPTLTRWHKILNRTYSQRQGRAEWFLKQRRASIPTRQRSSRPSSWPRQRLARLVASPRASSTSMKARSQQSCHRPPFEARGGV